MGYYGLAPSMSGKMAEPLTALEKALRALPLDQWEASLELIEKLCRNTAQQPAEEKFRKVKLTNERIKALKLFIPIRTGQCPTEE